jgi:transposase
MLEAWWARAHLSAISVISLKGQRYFHYQDHSMNSTDVVAFLAHLLREVPGRLVILWDGAPSYRSQLIQGCPAKRAAQRLHVERLPAYVPELNPGAGLWQHLKGVERHHVCGFDLQHLRAELRDAVKNVRRKPRIIHCFFRGAKR